ncbi:MAG: DDE-type integrase/transposase/recombinase [Actinobacteria bacterium]|nr:DDE-type integrase/transposase/recombinase [Actinomycetota bacterium]
MSIERTVRLEPGAIVTFRAETWRVAGLDGLRVHLSPVSEAGSPAVWLVNDVLACEDFKVLAGSDGVAVLDTDPGDYSDQYVFDTLEPEGQSEVQRRWEAVCLLRDGRLPGSPADPELEGLSQRDRLPVLARRFDVSKRTLQYWSARFQQGGVSGLVDRRARSTGEGGPLQKRIDARWREAIRVVFTDYHDRTTVTDGYLVDRVREVALERFGNDTPEASDRTLRRYIDEVAPGRKQAAKTRRSRGNAPSPDKWWKPLQCSRPGQVVAVDTQYLDAFALEPVSGEWQRVQLLMAVDIYSRSIVGWRFTAWTPNSQDVALLLRHIISPKHAPADWPSEGLWRYTGVPEHVVAGLLGSDPLYADESPLHDARDDLRVAGVPVLIPDELTLDHGRDYMSRDTKRACELLGITIGLARPYTPTDKAHVERAFATVNSGFVQRLPGYKGPDVHSRGARRFVEDGAFYTFDEIEERFAAWVAIEYQNAPHKGLRHAALPKVALSPNQMIDMAMTTSGFIPVPVDTNLQVELLTTKWRRVTNEGIQVGKLSYDFPGASVLDDYRNRPGIYGSPKGRDGKHQWRIKVDRRDLSGVWFYAFRNPENPAPGEGEWVRVPLRDLPDAVPFQERHLAFAKRLIIDAGGDSRDRDTVVKQLRRVLNSLSRPSDQLTTAEKRMVAHAHAHQLATHAAASSGLLSALPSDDDEQYYSGPESDTDAARSLQDLTAGGPPGSSIDMHPHLKDGQGLPFQMDEVDEWDPFDDDLADIA